MFWPGPCSDPRGTRRPTEGWPRCLRRYPYCVFTITVTVSVTVSVMVSVTVMVMVTVSVMVSVMVSAIVMFSVKVMVMVSVMASVRVRFGLRLELGLRLGLAPLPCVICLCVLVRNCNADPAITPRSVLVYKC